MAANLSLTMSAHRETTSALPSPSSANVSYFTNIVNSQVAGGDITNTTTMIDVLVQIENELERMDVAPEVKEEASGLVRKLLGKGLAAGGEGAASAAGKLVAAMLAQRFGISLDGG